MQLTNLLIDPEGQLKMKNLGYIGALLAAGWYAFAQTNSTLPTTSSELSFGPVNFAGYDNYVYRDNTTAVQVLLSE
jgi:hypothetical protein